MGLWPRLGGLKDGELCIFFFTPYITYQRNSANSEKKLLQK